MRPESIADYQEMLADHRRLAREIDTAMHGLSGAARQASLCDLVPMAKRMRERLEAMTDEVNRCRLRTLDLERVVARYVPDSVLAKDALPGRDRGAIVLARAQYSRRRARPK